MSEGRYNWNPAESSASFEVFPKGDVNILLGEPKPFERTAQNGSLSAGVRFACKIESVDPSYPDQNAVGKRIMVTCYMHNDGGRDFAKQIIMAALGFDVNAANERKFNEQFGAADWSFDPITGTTGDAWRQLTAAKIRVSLDVQPNPNDATQMQQKFGRFMPFRG